MKDIDSILLPKEVVVYSGSLHWIIYTRSAMLLLFALVLFICALATSTTQSVPNRDNASPDASSISTAQTTSSATTVKKHSKKQKSNDSTNSSVAQLADQGVATTPVSNVLNKQIHSFAYAFFMRGAFLFILLGLANILWNWWACSVALFVVTNKRVIMHHGIIRRQSFEILLKKLESFNVDQPLIGRLLGYGTLKVSSAGSVERFSSIANPVEFRHQITIVADAAQV